jgi:thimet oligopeptidase
MYNDSIMSKRPSSFLKLTPKSALDVSAMVDAALRIAEKELAALRAVSPKEKRTLENTLEPLNRIAIAIHGAGHQVGLFSSVHPDAKIRAAAEKATERLAKFFPKLYLSCDVYEAVCGVAPSGLNALARRFREKEILDFQLTGVDKPSSVRAEIRRLIGKTVKLGQAFDRVIKDDVRFVLRKPADLDGLPEDFCAAHAPDRRGMVKISTQYPDYVPFMKYAKSNAARRKLYQEFNNRGWPKNDNIFTELLRVRERQAALLGYRDWADYVTVDKMAKSAKTVQDFLDRVGRLTARRAKRDYAALVARKRKEEPGAKSVTAWEWAYYDNLVAQEAVGLDTQEVRNYFQFKLVKEGVLKSAGRLFGVSFRRARVSSWHPDVEVFDVYRGSTLIGRFHLDLHPREGKYGHAACFDVRLGIRGRQLPEAALVCNFSRERMDHSEVTTFFHEFGHLIHFVLAGNQEWARFSGFSTEWDFVEAPSQMFESWAFDYGTLRTFALHAETGKPITPALVEKMRLADSSGRGIWGRRQVFLSALSLAYHRKKKIARDDLLAILRREENKYAMLRYPAGTHMYASFGHLNSYSAMYYTYLWSLAIAEDILSPFKKNGMYDAKTARRYRDFVLAPGGSKDARQLVRDFLGREWNLKEFKRWLEE